MPFEDVGVELLPLTAADTVGEVREVVTRVAGVLSLDQRLALVFPFRIELAAGDRAFLQEERIIAVPVLAPGQPIVLEEELNEVPDVYYVLAWNFKKEILDKNQHLLDRGVEFYFPVNPEEHA